MMAWPWRIRITCSVTRNPTWVITRRPSSNVRQALDIFRELGDRANEGMVLNGLAAMLEKQERYPEALAVALDALRMLKAAGHWWTQANLENGVGWLYAHLGQYDRALTHCQQALSLHRDSGHRGGTADTLDSLGYIYLHLGDFAQAKAHYAKAIEAYREIGSPLGVGNSLTGLGDALLAEGAPSAAGTAWREAVAILDRLPHPRADEVRVRLRRPGEPACSPAPLPPRFVRYKGSELPGSRHCLPGLMPVNHERCRYW